ncbi:Holliday junction branch migration protein RuvA [Desulfuromonas carbonis]|uniref:Holliday junction branch migration protein RuvA n=1 Tax=Desulfuromonas sp. DDH964 TaxID=1823759 RepID=UPI00078DDB77|nr:Holliday junction branch migration protein RuvA [Desulfuromonas sp. DDH964]AMV72991.1 Holliday junction DNA helicase RuvA [Desulfuromonas sp. DDH964]
MIASLHGIIAYRSIDHVIVDVGGVGYRLLIPLSTFYALPEEGSVRFQVYTHVRDDAILLFGFLTSAERDLFVLLISVSGIGPKLALNILSHIPAPALLDALAEGDAKRLATLPGIGKKTAERLVLELQDKAHRLNPAHPRVPPQTGPTKTTSLEDAQSALVNLGYKEAQARKVLENMEISPDASLEEVLKGALKILLR